MAECIRYVCGSCNMSIKSWSDGNPYYIDAAGSKQYAYHPDNYLLSLCIGNDFPHLCLACGNEFNMDSRTPVATCPKCGSADIADSFHLSGKLCPYCKAGIFAPDPGFLLIS
jgi:predicted RNA-binding Zn-ribbon protein involved in translation (DUF1610 family)